MRKIICLCVAALMMCSLTACSEDLNHYTKKESEVLYEYLESQLTEAVGREPEE